MSNPVSRGPLRRLRGVRARLAAAYLVGATLAGVLSALAFATLLSHAVDQNVDSDLRITAAATAADVEADPNGGQAAPTIGPTHRGRSLLAITAVYDHSGRLVDAEPLHLPVDPARLVPRAGFASAAVAGRDFRFYRTTATSGGLSETIVVGQSTATSQDARSDAVQTLLVIVPIAIVLSAAGAWWISGAALRPVERMRADAQRLSESGAPELIGPPRTSDSLDRLAATFNGLLTQLHQSLERQRALVADAGHELRTPLAVLQAELEMADRTGRTVDDLLDSVRHARAETSRLASLAEDLLLLAQADGPTPFVRAEPTDPVEVVVERVQAHRQEARARGVTLGVEVAGEPRPVEADPAALRRILDNLLVNAVRHTPGGGAVDVVVGFADGAVTLAVEDDGEGFPEPFLPHAFDRFARADTSRSRSGPHAGSGLGLSIVQALARAHGGDAVAANRASGGAVVTVRLPERAVRS